MTIRRRLALGFCGLLVPLALGIAFGLNRMDVLHGIVQRTVVAEWEQSVLAHRVVGLMHDQMRETLLLFLPSGHDSLRAQIANRVDTITDLLDELERRCTDPKSCELLLEIRLRRGLYVASFARIAKLLDDGEQDKAATRMMEETVPVLEATLAETERLTRWQGERLAQSGAESLRMLQSGQWIITLLFGTALTAALLLGAWVLRGVLRPLGGEPEDVRELVERLAAGELDTEISVRKGDEGNLLDAMRVMRRNQRALMDARAAADRALRESDRRFQERMETLRDWVWEVDPDWRYTYASPQVRDLLGYAPEELIGRSMLELMPPSEAARISALLEACSARPEPLVALENVNLHRDGHRVVLETSARPFFDAQGSLAGYCGVDRDVTDRKGAEARRLAEAARLRDALVREVHHRIKNNLQTVISLLRRESKRHPGAAAVIDAAISQVQTIAVIHGLYGRAVRHSVRLCELVPAVVTNVNELTGVEVETDGPQPSEAGLLIRESETVAVALILNELITNAAKHAQPESGPHILHVALAREGSRGRVRITNPGRLPPGFDFDLSRGLGTGLGLVRALKPATGMEICFSQSGATVQVDVVVEPPVVCKMGCAHDQLKELAAYQERIGQSVETA
jgi:PAS domain S-box-containing protein